jgi:hypothetical protein
MGHGSSTPRVPLSAESTPNQGLAMHPFPSPGHSRKLLGKYSTIHRCGKSVARFLGFIHCFLNTKVFIK